MIASDQLNAFVVSWSTCSIQSSHACIFCLYFSLYSLHAQVPGGKVVVYTGLLKILEQDDELAAVLAHEVAHVLARHAVSGIPAPGVTVSYTIPARICHLSHQHRVK